MPEGIRSLLLDWDHWKAGLRNTFLYQLLSSCCDRTHEKSRLKRIYSWHTLEGIQSITVRKVYGWEIAHSQMNQEVKRGLEDSRPAPQMTHFHQLAHPQAFRT